MDGGNKKRELFPKVIFQKQKSVYKLKIVISRKTARTHLRILKREEKKNTHNECQKNHRIHRDKKRKQKNELNLLNARRVSDRVLYF